MEAAGARTPKFIVPSKPTDKILDRSTGGIASNGKRHHCSPPLDNDLYTIFVTSAPSLHRSIDPILTVLCFFTMATTGSSLADG